MVIVEVPTVTVKCSTAIKALVLYFILCLSVLLDSPSCSVHPYHLLVISNPLFDRW